MPAIVDIASGQLVTNDYPQMTLDLLTEWTEHPRPGAPDLYPEAQRDEIDEIAELATATSTTGCTPPASPVRRTPTPGFSIGSTG